MQSTGRDAQISCAQGHDGDYGGCGSRDDSDGGGGDDD